MSEAQGELDSPFANSNGLLFLLANGLNSRTGGLRIAGSSLPVGRNLLEVATDQGKILEVRSAATLITSTIRLNANTTLNDPATLTIGANGQIDFQNALTLSAQGSGNGVKIGTATQKIGFYNATPVAKQTGVAVDITAVHTALVNLGLIGA